MADTDESFDCASDISGTSVLIPDENIGLHLRKKATVSKEPNNETISEGIDGENEQRVPETIGRASFTFGEEPSASEKDATAGTDGKPCPEQPATTPSQGHVSPENENTSKNGMFLCCFSKQIRFALTPF